MKRLLGFSVGLLALPGLAAMVALTASAATRNVAVQDNAFVDAVSMNSTTTIVVGDTVQWNWSGANPHTVSSTGTEAFDSGAPAVSDTLSHVFNAEGSFSYICNVHGTAMSGTIIVQGAQAPTNTPQSTATTAAATNTPAASSSSTPATAAAPSSTPVASSPVSSSVTPGAGSPAPSGTQAGGGALPTAGTGSSGEDRPWAAIAAFAAVAGLCLAGAAAFRMFRRPDL
jgi:plastocyanin